MPQAGNNIGTPIIGARDWNDIAANMGTPIIGIEEGETRTLTGNETGTPIIGIEEGETRTLTESG